MIPEQLTIDQASEILGIRPNSLRAMCKAGQIKHRRIGLRSWMYRFEMVWLEEYLASTVKEPGKTATKSVKPNRDRVSISRPKKEIDYKARVKALKKAYGR